MALFENFPYTNLHELNLDWLIKVLNELKDTQVLSVNGQTGEVILYQDAQVLLPEVSNDHWSIGRVADGTYRGIMFGNNNLAYIVHENQMSQLYAANNPPPYPVTSVNGQTGDVVLYSEASVRLPSLTDAEIHKWNIWRWINNTMSGIEFDDTGKAFLIVNANRYNIYTSNDQPPYPVTSVNGQTGDVELDIPESFVDDPEASELTIAEDIPDSSVWALLRETENGYVGIAVNNGVNPAAYLQIGSGSSAQQIKLLTLDDIPSSSGVVSINGLTGVVSINGANLDVSGTDTRKINVVLSGLETDVSALQDMDDYIREALIFDEQGQSAATHNIPAGSFVYWNNGTYTASQAISIGDTLSSTNLTAVPTGGAINALNSNFTNYMQQLAHDTTNINNSFVNLTRVVGNLYVISGWFSVITSLETDDILFTLPSGYSILQNKNFYYPAFVNNGSQAFIVGASGFGDTRNIIKVDRTPSVNTSGKTFVFTMSVMLDHP